MTLTRDDILAVPDLKSEVVDVPEWGGSVIVATMSGEARDRFESSVLGKDGKVNTANIRAKLAASTIVDESGKLLFNESDIEMLGRKSCAALDRVFAASQKLNLISNADVEALAKN